MLVAENLSKSYKGKKALTSISFTLENGIYALLGPNGAGKSTLMNLLTDNLTADSGKILWNGQPISRLGRSYRKVLGYMPQQQGLYHEFTGRRFLAYVAALKGLPKKTVPREIERVSHLVNLGDELDKFDEPTAGLDPYERVRTRNLFTELGKERIVLIATHVVSDIETIANQIMLLKKGSLAAYNTPQNLILQYCPGGSMEDVYLRFFENEVNQYALHSTL